MGAGTFSERHEMIQADYSLKPEITLYCVYYSLKYKDYAARNIGKNSFLIIETCGYISLHPDSPKLDLMFIILNDISINMIRIFNWQEITI